MMNVSVVASCLYFKTHSLLKDLVTKKSKYESEHFGSRAT